MQRFGSKGRLSAVILVAVVQSGCLYGFAGGGLPPHIRTIAILPFDNRTGEVALTQEVAEAVRQAMENRLGLREADQPLSFQQREGGNVSVTRRLVQIAVSVEIYDVREDRMLWQRAGIRVEGEYEPPGEDERKGRELALERLVLDIVDGAQSQW